MRTILAAAVFAVALIWTWDTRWAGALIVAGMTWLAVRLTVDRKVAGR